MKFLGQHKNDLSYCFYYNFTSIQQAPNNLLTSNMQVVWE